MDPFTHLFITRKLIGKDGWATLASLLPDLPFYLTYPSWLIARRELRQALVTNNWPEPPAWMKSLHHAFHSLPVLAVLVVFFRLISGKWPKKIALAWALHIFIDIPTHSRKQWGPQFLWPLSDVSVDGISWAEAGLELIRGIKPKEIE